MKIALLAIFLVMPVFPQDLTRIEKLRERLRLEGVPETTDTLDGPGQDLFQANLREFHADYDKFERKLYGCQVTGYEPCHPELGKFDSKLWKKLCREAKRVFSNEKLQDH